MTPTSILLLPAPEHREALLGDSPGGGKVPTRFACSRCGCTRRSPAGGDEDACNQCDGCGGLFNGWGVTLVGALILRWRGADDPMGCARVAEVIGSEHRDARPGWWAPARDIASIVDGEMDHIGRVIYLDADGREVSP